MKRIQLALAHAVSMIYRIVLFFQEKISTYFIVFRLKDDLSPVEEVVGEVMPKSDDSDDDNIAPVEVAGVVLPKRTP